MNNQTKLMNPPPPPHRMMNLPPSSQVMNPVQPRIMNQNPLLGQSHPIMSINQQPQILMNNQPMMMIPHNFNHNPSLSSEYQNPPSNNFRSKRNNWKRKKITSDKRLMMEQPRMHNSGISMYNHQQVPGSGYKPPNLNELQSRNRLKTRKSYPKKKNGNRYVPYAPRNTTSFIIRAKKSGGITDLVSPCPVTPAVLPTPMFSPSREVFGDMAKEEWGVDGYGSMKGLIRLRADGNELEDEDDEGESGSSESDVEEHVEVERRIDHDLSRFEMIYPSYGGSEYNNVLENRVDDQDSHIAQLEEENLTLKKRLFFMENELGDMRRRLQYLERRDMVAEDANEGVVENESESDGYVTGGSEARTSGETKENHVVAEDFCMQYFAARDDTAVKEINNNNSCSGNKLEGKDQTETDYQENAGEQSEEANDVVGMDQSKETELVVEKLGDASENDLLQEQGSERNRNSLNRENGVVGEQ